MSAVTAKYLCRRGNCCHVKGRTLLNPLSLQCSSPYLPWMKLVFSYHQWCPTLIFLGNLLGSQKDLKIKYRQWHLGVNRPPWGRGALWLIFQSYSEDDQPRDQCNPVLSLCAAKRNQMNKWHKHLNLSFSLQKSNSVYENSCSISFLLLLKKRHHWLFWF